MFWDKHARRHLRIHCGQRDDGIEYSGLPKNPVHVRYHQTHQGISDKPGSPTIHQVPGAPMMLQQVLSTRRRCHSDG
jgi:hypothetical protein